MSTAVDTRDLERKAQRAIEARRFDEALTHLWLLVDRASVVDDQFRLHVRLLAQCFGGLGRRRALAAAQLYLGDVGEAETSSPLPLDRARIATHKKNHALAARLFEEAGWIGHAAIALELAKNDTGARILWELTSPEAPHGELRATRRRTRRATRRSAFGPDGAATR